MTADFESFLKRRGDAGIRNDIARLWAARIVFSVEVDEGKALAEGLLKMLTGGDTAVARFLYREPFEFMPRFTLWLAANERPRVRAEDAAIWRRILQVPFTQVIPEDERDERVKIELRSNPDVRAAILAWAVNGCLAWQREGLAVPECVRDYTNEYRAENDPVREWLADRCLLDAGAWTSTASLRESYEGWCEANGEKPLGMTGLRNALRGRGLVPEKRGAERGWCGIAIDDDPEPL
jgi:putative DNA primase/helicase